MGVSDKTLALISKILNICCAILLVVIAIIRFVYEGSSLGVLDAIWTFYWIVFGIFILLAELKVGVFLRYLNFLSGYLGKGLFITFCGTLLIDQWSWKTIMGIILICNGVLCIVLGFRLKDSGDGAAHDIKEPIQQDSIENKA